MDCRSVTPPPSKPTLPPPNTPHKSPAAASGPSFARYLPYCRFPSSHEVHLAVSVIEELVGIGALNIVLAQRLSVQVRYHMIQIYAIRQTVAIHIRAIPLELR